jgi:RNA polymerase sigma factor (TIGR02999 family)
LVDCSAMTSPRNEVTRLLQDWNEGDIDARDQLIPLVFDELRRIARHQLAKERSDHTLEPTALVHELYLRLVDQRSVRWQSRRDFFAVSATLIRRVLVDHARQFNAAKRGSGGPKISLDEALGLHDVADPDVLALDDALKELELIDPRGSRVVELHIFTGLDFKEIGEVLEISRSTVIRDWTHAKLWLRRELSRS